MLFAKRQLPLIICFVVGVVTALQDFVPTNFSQKVSIWLSDWYIIAAMFASLLGFGSVALVHSGRIRRQMKGWGYSVLVFVGVVAMFAVGVISGGKEVSDSGSPTPLTWMYVYAMVPLQATMFSLLGFYVASAAFRSFRAKSLESTLLLAAALIVLIGNVPFSNYLWSAKMGLTEWQGIKIGMPDIVGWVMSTPNVAARRGVAFGVALGAIATALKIIFGIERAYLGGGD
ncbi:MAG: hypothetical protein HYY18_08945 [Planctomycetes bacterium]|nr:hypothetical protein [Planctomycetota bacterium]